MRKILIWALPFLMGSVCHAEDITIRYSGSTVKVEQKTTDSVNVAVDGAKVCIESLYKGHKLTIRMKGMSDEGQLVLKTAGKAKVTLDGLNLTSQEGAPLDLKNKKKVEVVVAKGTENTLRDGETYDMVDGEDQKAALFSEGQILVSGKGQLNIYSSGKSCMTSDDYVFVRPGTKLYLNSTSGHGIKAKDFVYIKGGVINMEIAADGAKGINCDSLIYITGGRTTIINSGTTEFGTDSLGNVETTGAAGVKTDYNMTMTGGTLNIKCTGDDAKGVNVTEPLLFTGGELNVVLTGKNATMDPKGVKCDTDCTIQGGSFYSCALNGRAMDVNGTLTIEPGYTTLNDKNYHLFEVSY